LIPSFDAWQNGRPVFNRLPDTYKDNTVSDWVSTGADKELTLARLNLDDLNRQMNPLTCDARWLDYLSYLCGWTSDYWDRGWPENSKRLLLAGSYSVIWPKKGSKESLGYVLSSLTIPHVIRESGSFIIGESLVGDPLGAIAWEYDIILPSVLFNSKEFRTTVKINRLFGPLWCKSEIVFDDNVFSPEELLEIAASTLLSVGDPQTVVGLN